LRTEERRESKAAERLEFQPPVPMDEAISGDQPPITGLYPRVVFPAEGSFNYAIFMLVDREESRHLGLGTQFEEGTVTLPTTLRLKDSIKLPENCPCPEAVREAISGVYGGGKIPAGEYKLRLEVARKPVVSIRIDGG